MSDDAKGVQSLTEGRCSRRRRLNVLTEVANVDLTEEAERLFDDLLLHFPELVAKYGQPAVTNDVIANSKRPEAWEVSLIKHNQYLAQIKANWSNKNVAQLSTAIVPLPSVKE